MPTHKAAPAKATKDQENAVIDVHNLSFAYDDKQIFQHAHLSISASEFVALVGDNGVGKSTFMKLLLHKLDPQEGEIKLFGDDIRRNNHYADLAFVSQNACQNYRSFPTTIEELVRISASYLSLDEDVDELISMVELGAHKHKRLSELSGGQLQRVGILLALIKKAPLILLDEPTSGVDKVFSHELYRLLGGLSQKGKTILLITHHVHELSDVHPRVVRVHDGRFSELRGGI